MAESAAPSMMRATAYGDGLFETMLFKDGRCALWSRHWQRLERGCHILGLAVPSMAAVRQQIGSTLGHSAPSASADGGVVKLLVCRAGPAHGYQPSGSGSVFDVSVRPVPPPREPARLHFCTHPLSVQAVLGGLKHLNRLDQVLAAMEVERAGADEGLMCHPDGGVVEGTFTNLFWREHQQLFTPAIDQCGVRGVMRDWVCDQFAVEETGPVPPDRLKQAAEIFLTNSVLGAWPVAQLGRQRYAGGPASKKINQALKRFRKEHHDS